MEVSEQVQETVAADEAPAAEVKSSPKKRKKPVPAEGSRRSGRARKQVKVDNIGHTETKVQTLPKGPGTAFNDIPLIAGRINAASFTSDHILGKKLYRICFGQASKKLNLKKHLRKFSGFDEESADSDVKKLTVWCTKNCDVANHLKPLLGWLDLQVTGTKEELVDRLLTFLRSPEDSGAEYTPFSMGKRKAKKSTKKKSKKKKASAPRKKSGYMVYLGEHRAAFKKKHPEYSMVEVTKGLAAKWGKLTDAQKEDWKEKAAALPAPSPKKKTTKKKATKKKPKKKAESSSEEESESEEESSDDDAPLGDDVEDRLDAAVKKIVNEGDLATLTKGKIRELLAPEFGDAVGENKARIKDCIKKYTAIKLKSA